MGLVRWANKWWALSILTGYLFGYALRLSGRFALGFSGGMLKGVLWGLARGVLWGLGRGMGRILGLGRRRQASTERGAARVCEVKHAGGRMRARNGFGGGSRGGPRGGILRARVI